MSAPSSAAAAARLGAVTGLATQVISVGVTVVLARLLAPEQFGLVAISQSVLGLAALVTATGLGARLVLSPTLSKEHVSTVFWASAAVVGTACGALTLLARPVLDLLDQPGATDLVRVLCLSLVLSTLASVPRAVLQRQMRLRVVYGVELVSVVVYAVVQIVLAVLGAQAMAVAVGQLAMSACQLGLLLALTPAGRPGRSFRPGLVKEGLRFSSGIFANSGVQFLSKNLDYWFVGRVMGATQLGVYYVSFTLPNILRQRISNVIAEVGYPVLARSRGDLPVLASLYLRTVRLSFFLACPLMAGLALLPEEVLGVFFGESWLDGAAPLRIIAVAAALEVTVPVITTLTMVLDRPGQAATLQLVRLGASVVLLGLFHVWVGGLVGVAAAVGLAVGVSAVAGHVRLARQLSVPLRTLLMAFSAPLPGVVVMGAAVLGTRAVLPTEHLVLVLAVCVPVGAAAFLAGGALLGRAAFWRDVTELRRLAVPAGLEARLSRRRHRS